MPRSNFIPDQDKISASMDVDIYDEMNKTSFALQHFICEEDVYKEGSMACNKTMKHETCDADNVSVHVKNNFNTYDKCVDVKHQSSWHPGW